MWQTIIIAAVIATAFISVIVRHIINRKKGKSSCACGCGACAMKGICHKD